MAQGELKGQKNSLWPNHDVLYKLYIKFSNQLLKLTGSQRWISAMSFYFLVSFAIKKKCKCIKTSKTMVAPIFLHQNCNTRWFVGWLTGANIAKQSLYDHITAHNNTHISWASEDTVVGCLPPSEPPLLDVKQGSILSNYGSHICQGTRIDVAKNDLYTSKWS